MTQYIFHGPVDYAFADRDGHGGKVYSTGDSSLEYLLIDVPRYSPEQEEVLPGGV